jgi:hypothetical protein
MSNRLGPIEIQCDAPPYGIVRACRRLGVRAPEDVRWFRVGQVPVRPLRWTEVLRQPWKLFLGGTTQPDAGSCPCGADLPRLERCTFTLASGKTKAYRIGQCRRCQTIFWEET